MNDEFERAGSRVVDFCIGLLVAALALWAVVQIIPSIWVWLCGIALLLGLGSLIYWLAVKRRQRW